MAAPSPSPARIGPFAERQFAALRCDKADISLTTQFPPLVVETTRRRKIDLRRIDQTPRTGWDQVRLMLNLVPL